MVSVDREDYLTVFSVETGQKESSADALDDGGDESYLNLEVFLPDAPTVDVIITTRHVRAAEITTLTTLTTVEIEEIEITETMELSQKFAKLQPSGPDVNKEVL